MADLAVGAELAAAALQVMRRRDGVLPGRSGHAG